MPYMEDERSFEEIYPVPARDIISFERLPDNSKIHGMISRCNYTISFRVNIRSFEHF